MNDTLMRTWTCRKQSEGCLSAVDGTGDPSSLRDIGWFVEEKSDGDLLLFCPRHHPKHEEEKSNDDVTSGA
jgi:hypothetical protein